MTSFCSLSITLVIRELKGITKKTKLKIFKEVNQVPIFLCQYLLPITLIIVKLLHLYFLKRAESVKKIVPSPLPPTLPNLTVRKIWRFPIFSRWLENLADSSFTLAMR